MGGGATSWVEVGIIVEWLREYVVPQAEPKRSKKRQSVEMTSAPDP